MGQVMDTETRADRSLQQFTMERYKLITKYRTAYHTFQMPVSLALYMVIVIYILTLQRRFILLSTLTLEIKPIKAVGLKNLHDLSGAKNNLCITGLRPAVLHVRSQK
jgi:hypothetical protein